MPSRSSAATPAIAAAQAAGLEHTVHSYDHDPTAQSYGMEAATALGIDARIVFKTLLAEVDAVAVCALVPVTTTVSLKALAQAHGGKRARMMDPVKAQRLSGYVVGGISPLGQRTPSPTYLDSSALSLERIYVSAGRRGLEISLSPVDLIDLTGARAAPIATPDPAPEVTSGLTRGG
jgi:Cys-tRNA(Pro)/Cys-tRNA(Cys) deacylase